MSSFKIRPQSSEFTYHLSEFPTFFTSPTDAEKRFFFYKYKSLLRQMRFWLKKTHDFDEDMIFDFEFGFTVREILELKSVIKNHHNHEFLFLPKRKPKKKSKKVAQ